MGFFLLLSDVWNEYPADVQNVEGWRNIPENPTFCAEFVHFPSVENRADTYLSRIFLIRSSMMPFS